ncbi:MBL fold metallo-hydrolase [Pusillimonas sp. TS35]|nr:MBL fold metallo-hydrolase [Pusillimonas sp. TS35]
MSSLRRILRSILPHAALGIACTTAPLATAATPPAAPTSVGAPHATQVPGYYRQQVGAVTVTALYDGYIGVNPAMLHGLQTKDIQTLIARMFQRRDDGGVQTAVNGYLVQTGNRLILIDTGASSCLGATLGHIGENIQAAGYQPSDISDVVLTHLHPDHVCGAINADGAAAYPNATMWAPNADSDYWLSPEVAAAAPQDARVYFDMARKAVAPYVDAGKFKTFDGGEVVPGLNAVATHGHTPGHTSYLLQSEGATLLIWGDIVHAHAVQFRHPEVSIEFDTNQASAITTRTRVFREAASQGWMVAGAHLPFPGLGHLRKEQQGYAWVPIEYAPFDRTGDVSR